MGQYIRVTTKDKVYLLGQPMPVPEGCPVEPFTIANIEWDQDNEIVEFVCFPDRDAVAKPPVRGDENDEQWEAIERYHEQAKQLVADDLVLVATISSRDARVEMLMQRAEYVEALTKPDEEDGDDGEDGEGETTTKPEPSSEQPPPKPEQPLPPEISVATE